MPSCHDILPLVSSQSLFSSSWLLSVNSDVQVDKLQTRWACCGWTSTASELMQELPIEQLFYLWDLNEDWSSVVSFLSTFSKYLLLMLKAPGLKFTERKASEPKMVRCTPFRFALLENSEEEGCKQLPTRPLTTFKIDHCLSAVSEYIPRLFNFSKQKAF